MYFAKVTNTVMPSSAIDRISAVCIGKSHFTCNHLVFACGLMYVVKAADLTGWATRCRMPSGGGTALALQVHYVLIRTSSRPSDVVGLLDALAPTDLTW